MLLVRMFQLVRDITRQKDKKEYRNSQAPFILWLAC
jgi:hypothetical protein